MVQFFCRFVTIKSSLVSLIKASPSDLNDTRHTMSISVNVWTGLVLLKGILYSQQDSELCHFTYRIIMLQT